MLYFLGFGLYGPNYIQLHHARNIAETFSMELKLPPSSLVVFLDDTGHERLPNGHVVYGLGGCAVLDTDLDRLIRLPWKEVRRAIVGDPETPLHAAGLTMTRDQQALVGDFFRANRFMRVATAASAGTFKPDSLMLTEVLAPALLRRICEVMTRTSATSVVLIFEANDRTKTTIQRCFGRITIEESGTNIPMQCYFMPKSAGEPALEVADFIMHSVHGLARDRFEGKDGYKRRDFRSVFQSVDRRLVSFILIDRIEFGPNSDINSGGH